MPNYSKRDPRYQAGYRAARRSAQDSVYRLVGAIAEDINRRSGLSPMLWSDREQREMIINEWCEKLKAELEKV